MAALNDFGDFGDPFEIATEETINKKVKTITLTVLGIH
jgi:hypothetical protein